MSPPSRKPRVRRDAASRRIVVVVVPPVDELDLVGPLQVFNSINRLAGRPIYSAYSLEDQRIAGGIMLMEGGVVTLIAFAWLFLRWTREAELRQSLLDAGTDPSRAERAGRYGTVAASASATSLSASRRSAS